MNENFDAFDDYVMKFDMNEERIKYKYNHSYRVVHQCEEIARSLKLDEDNRDLASLIGLLHDFARFEQLKQHKTFDDSKSFDHGDYAVKLLFDDNYIKNFKYNKKYENVIKKAIMYHNKFSIDEENCNFDEILHSKIIRDADKLDILYAFSDNRILEISDDGNGISKRVNDSFINHMQVKNEDIKTKDERVISLISLVFDLNYDYSKRRVLEEKYIDKIYESLEHKAFFKKFFDEVNNYLKEEVKDVR